MQGIFWRTGRFPVHIQPNVERSEALKVLAEEGTLLVLCSLVDNMPYVLAEAAVSKACGRLARALCAG